MDATSATRTEVAEPVLEEITARIEHIMLNRESGNGNRYTRIATSTADIIYVWNDAWRHELKQQYAFYYGLDAHLYVRDKRNLGEEEPFYWLEAVIPQNRKLTAQFVERWQRYGQQQLLDAVAQCRKHSDSPHA